jgi:hypothetical protein
MRCLLVALGLIASICGASAQEFELPPLRGSDGWMPAAPTNPGWGGIYVGGQAGYSTAGGDFGNGVNSMASYILRNTIFESIVSTFNTLPKMDTNGGSFGGFVGYNTQWEGVVLGFEVNYNRTRLSKAAADSVSVRIANDATAPPGHHFIYDPFILSGSASVSVTDLATFRARARDGQLDSSCPTHSGGCNRARRQRALGNSVVHEDGLPRYHTTSDSAAPDRDFWTRDSKQYEKRRALLWVCCRSGGDVPRVVENGEADAAIVRLRSFSVLSKSAVV